MIYRCNGGFTVHCHKFVVNMVLSFSQKKIIAKKFCAARWQTLIFLRLLIAAPLAYRLILQFRPRVMALASTEEVQLPLDDWNNHRLSTRCFRRIPYTTFSWYRIAPLLNLRPQLSAFFNISQTASPVLSGFSRKMKAYDRDSIR